MHQNLAAADMPEHRAHFPMHPSAARSVQAAAVDFFGLPAFPRMSLGGNVKLILALIPPGEFVMGASPGDPHALPAEAPAHLVTFRMPFYIGRYPVTQAQWQTVMEDAPSSRQGNPAQLPVDSVSWERCVEFCRRLSEMSGSTVRLPSEAEWEYACRAGSASIYAFGDNPFDLKDYGWYRDNAGGLSQPVGLLSGNAWRLHDMHGGVSEFCLDAWHTDYVRAPADGRPWIDGGDPHRRILRGGSLQDPAEYCRSSHRNYGEPDVPSTDRGLRVVLEIRAP